MGSTGGSGGAGAHGGKFRGGEREREEQIGEDETIQGIFFAMFATEVLCGMPCQLWLFTWCVWDLG